MEVAVSQVVVLVASLRCLPRVGNLPLPHLMELKGESERNAGETQCLQGVRSLHTDKTAPSGCAIYSIMSHS